MQNESKMVDTKKFIEYYNFDESKILKQVLFSMTSKLYITE